MAEPGADIAVRDAEPVEGAVAKSDPDLLLTQIEQTREDLARTIDDLAERVSPASKLRHLRDRAAAQLAKPEVQLGAAAAGLAVVGLAILRVWARRRGGR